ncbi:MAG TPA: hypothetical protein DDZ11_13055 [Lentisphaeria bacterium]|nr:hypothetical protein [Lentisphaeria bacterium]
MEPSLWDRRRNRVQNPRCCVHFCPMSNDQRNEREMRERRRRVVTRTVCIVIAAAMLISVVVPAIYAGL